MTLYETACFRRESGKGAVKQNDLILSKGFAMTIKWIKTPHKGLRYYEHATRKHVKKKDRYYAIRFKVDGKDYGYGIGWWSEGIPEEAKKNDPDMGFEEYAISQLKLYKANVKAGSGVKSPKEKRKIAAEVDEHKKAEHARLEKESITFGDYMTKQYLPQCKMDKKPSTYANEEALYRLHLAGTIGKLPFWNISAFHLERIKKDMADKKMSDRSIQYALQLTRQAFHTAKKLHIYTGDSPTNAVKWPKLDNMKLRYLSIAETETLLKALAAKSKNLHDVAFLSLHCGLRFGEIAALTWGCVNFEAGTLAILNAKTGSRTAYLTAPAKTMLKNRKQGKPDELIFPKRTREGGEMVRSSKVFADTVKELGFNQGITDRKQKVTFHTLRHTMATHLYEASHDLYLVQRSLGHSTGTMTARYAKMSENRLREGAAALEKAFAIGGTKQAEQNQYEQVVPVQVANLAK
jgi:integrase